MDQCLSEWSQLGNHWLLHRHLKSDEGYWRHFDSKTLKGEVDSSHTRRTCGNERVGRDMLTFQAFMSSSFKHLQAIGRLDRLAYTKSH